MATLTGILAGAILYQDGPIDAEYGNRAEPDYLTGTDTVLQLAGFGALNDTQPIDERVAVLTGVDQPSYGFLDWYNRIHFSALTVNLGNVASAQEYSLRVFNAYLVQRTLDDVVQSGDDGLVLTEPGATPLVFEPLEELTYLISISAEGAPTIEGEFEFQFDVRTATVTVTGVRTVAWYWEPNYIEPVLERLKWKTDLQPLRDGSEQRRELLAGPRSSWEFTYDIADRQRRAFENVIADWGAGVWALPIWPDVAELASQLTAGSTDVPIDPEGYHYEAGGLAVFIGANGAHELVEVDSIGSSSLTLLRETLATWPAGTRVYPAREARLTQRVEFSRLSRNYIRGRVRFDTVDEVAGLSIVEGTYRGQPVLVREPNWLEDPLQHYERHTSIIDYGVGKVDVVDRSGISAAGQRVRWTMLDRDEADYFEGFLFARRGRQKGVWVPTWAEDLVLAAPIGASDVTAEVEHASLTGFAAANPHRQDIRIQLKDGTVFYRRVSGFSEIDANIETLTIDSNLGQVVEPADVDRISWLYFVRLEQDEIERAWHTCTVAESVITFTGPNHGV